ncbi:MAG: hypothetical protein EBU16_01545 [Actinobacteria bacterium]|nr:hypothetical protein [Actinomycetota bacterium]NBQ35186.1 hypothetical protein [Actinomycetota bacterium]
MFNYSSSLRSINLLYLR